MYAVIKTGGKQYRVAKDDVIFVEKLTAEPGAKVELDEVLLVDEGKGPVVGAPLVDGAKVAATVLEQKRGDKIIVFKKKRRKNHRRMRGHRQDITVLRITDILPKGKKATRSRAKATKDDEAPAAVEEPAATEAEAAPKEEAAPKATAKPRARAKPKASADKADAKETAPKKPRARRTTKKDDDAAGSEETS